MRISSINNVYINRFQAKKQINFTSNQVEVETEKKYDFATTYHKGPHNNITVPELVEIIKPIHSNITLNKAQIIKDIEKFEKEAKELSKVAQELYEVYDKKLNLPKNVKEATVETVEDPNNPNIKYECQRPYNPQKITTYDEDGKPLFSKDINDTVVKYPQGDDKYTYVLYPSKYYDPYSIVKRFNEKGEEDLKMHWAHRGNIVSSVCNSDRSFSPISHINFKSDKEYYVDFFEHPEVDSIRVSKDSDHKIRCQSYKSTVEFYDENKNCYHLTSLMSYYSDKCNPNIELYLSNDGKSIDKIRNYRLQRNYSNHSYDEYDSGVISLEKPIAL